MKILLPLLLLLYSSLTFAMSAKIDLIHLCKDNKITKVVLHKHDHELTLICNDFYGTPMVAKSYDVMLSKEAIGPKEKEGDQKVPEGKYKLDWKLKKSKFFRAIHVSYPNKKDRENARRNGITNLGGDIMLHGMPNKIAGYDIDLQEHPILREIIYQAMYFVDWTQGCIAVKNDEIQEIWNLVKTPIPFEIFP